ncbi:MAG TPA: hypothetical protein VKZ58_07585 [Longimicrobiales bacterium]|nr:hypothetical protein [Longimicrobiales bacterium]
MNANEKCRAAEALLHENGLPGARVRAEGHAEEIAAVNVPPESVAKLAALAPAIKALGFRYVALDLSE